MAHRSQSSSIGENPLDPNYLPPHYREEYRLAIDALIENDIQGYFEFLQTADVVSFLARTEIEHIKSMVQGPSHTSSVPELTYQDGGQELEGSSDTYWPMQSDLAAPGLDLGWPLPQHSFIGPTEVTTLVNPSDPDMPSIKEQARRLIKNAHQVVAVVMDMFTDVDIFSDLLDAAARHVPVYILLDEQDAHHFVSMVINCKVNLDLVPMMRVRTVAGITYYSRTGKSFKGQVKDRFLLADCRAVLSGNYSFMWSYEKIHRCIAHLFLGELVTTFDEEFRILFAQSEPLNIDPSEASYAMSDTSSTSSYLSGQFGLKRTQSLRNPLSYRRQPELPSAFPYGDSALPFRRNDPFRHTVEPGAGITIGKYSQQQFRRQQTYLEQGRSIVSRQMELSSSSFKRHSYAEGTQENYTSSRQFMKHRIMNNLDETDFHREQTMSSQYYTEGPGPGSGHGHYDRLRGRPPQLAIDQYSDSSYRSDLEPPSGGNFGHEYFSSDDLRGPDGQLGPPVAGRYGGGSSSKRPTIGQAYACQSSPTHPHAPEKKQYPKQPDQENDQDENAKQGLRSWRIHSYLSTYEDGGEEGLNQPLGPDAFEDPAPPQPPAENSAPRFGLKELPNLPSKPKIDIPRPRFGKPILPESTSKASGTTTAKDLLPSVSEMKPFVLEKEREQQLEPGATKEVGGDVEVKEAPELLLSKHESFRTRINPLLQRSSRLRSSLIFSSSKAEMHSGSLGLKPATEQDEELDSIRTSSIVAQILEKRRSMSREPFDWRKKAEEKEMEKDKDEKEKQEKEKEKERQQEEKKIKLEVEIKTKEEQKKSNEDLTTTLTGGTSDVTMDSLQPQQTPSLNMNDPASRLQYFQDLAAKRKASKMGTESSLKAPEPVEKKPDLSDKPPTNTTSLKIPSVSVTKPEPEPKKLDISAKLAELTRRPSMSSSKPPPIPIKPSASFLKPSETTQTQKEENAPESHKKDIFRSLKPLPSPKIFKRDPLKLKGLNPRRISCGEEILATDATDAEKSEMKKNRSHSSSTLPRDESKEKMMGSTTSINTLGEGKSDKTLDFLKKQTQRLKGFLGPKDKEKKSSGDDRTMSAVPEVTDSSKKQSSSAKDTDSTIPDQTTSNHKVSTGLSGPSRYQTPGSSVLFSSNLRDDTKVILEQISANSQKNRQEREESGGDKDSDTVEKVEKQGSLKRNRFLRAPQGTTQEREGLLKRIESLRKEKKVYSRFEMGNSLG
ncbi:LOW QUALITY PROTEIN: protein FAM83H [Sphaeramia orbicularis]|uniref:LOW QUALITY PROTEIN: protein FAM83H n=1 Tax=Sphaeramia orbicularis TaxID=375764 RepID=UPI001180214C|nr:LOW QUALITY PROTEIN: protein FAM83H [Sphaeramia orbicularis]